MHWKSLCQLLSNTGGHKSKCYLIHTSFSAPYIAVSSHEPHPRLHMGLCFPNSWLREELLAVPCLEHHKERENWLHGSRETYHHTERHVWRSHDVKCVLHLAHAYTNFWVWRITYLLQIYAAKWIDHTSAVPATGGEKSWMTWHTNSK